MTAVQVEQVTQTIVDDLNSAADFAGIIDPELIPFIHIGKAVDKLLPGLAGTVAGWIAGNLPTQADLDKLHADLAALGNPDTL